MRAICIDTPIIGFDNVKPCVTFTTSMAAFFTLQHVSGNKIPKNVASLMAFESKNEYFKM